MVKDLHFIIRFKKINTIVIIFFSVIHFNINAFSQSNKNQHHDQNLVGTWSLKRVFFSNQTWTSVYVFNTNGTGIYRLIGNEKDENGSSDYVVECPFVWETTSKSFVEGKFGIAEVVEFKKTGETIRTRALTKKILADNRSRSKLRFKYTVQGKYLYIENFEMDGKVAFVKQ